MQTDTPIDVFDAPAGCAFELPSHDSKKSFDVRPKEVEDMDTDGKGLLRGDPGMKDFDIIIAGEHISYEARDLRFGELQANPSNGKSAGDAAIDHAEYSKWFRLDTVSIYIVGYDADGERKTIAQPYKNGHIVDDGFVQTFSNPESHLGLFGLFTYSRRAKCECAAWSELKDDAGFRMDRLKFYKNVRTWDDGEKVICLVGFEYDGVEIILADETVCESYGHYVGNTRIADGQTIHDAFKSIGIASNDALAKEYIAVKDTTGADKGFFRIGYELEREDEGVMICVEPCAFAKCVGSSRKWLFPCSRVKEWKVVPTGTSDENGEYIVADPDVYHVATIKSSPFWFDVREDWVYMLDEDGDVEPIEFSNIDKRKAMAEISEGEAGRELCVRLLRELDVHLAFRNFDDACLAAIWTADDVPCDWKYETLEKIADRKHTRNVVPVPVEFVSHLAQTSAQNQGGDEITVSVDCVVLLLFENNVFVCCRDDLEITYRVW